MRFSPIAGLSYIVVTTDKAALWQEFATELLGLMPSKLALPEGSCAFRMDDRMARFIVEPGSDSVSAVGWEVRGRPEWDDLLTRLARAGVETEQISGEEAHARGVAQLCRIQDPAGETVEFAFQPFRDSIDRFVSPLGVDFVTNDMGMGHITRAVANYEETVEFYTEVLGFRVRETIDTAMRATFASPNPRHHSIALVDGHGENHVHHVMLEVDSIDDVGRCLDRVAAGAAPQTTGLGRHFNDLMISFYMASPSGLEVEYGYGGLRVDLDQWVENTQGGVGGPSLWGHRPIESSAP